MCPCNMQLLDTAGVASEVAMGGGVISPGALLRWQSDYHCRELTHEHLEHPWDWQDGERDPQSSQKLPEGQRQPDVGRGWVEQMEPTLPLCPEPPGMDSGAQSHGPGSRLHLGSQCSAEDQLQSAGRVESGFSFHYPLGRAQWASEQMSGTWVLDGQVVDWGDGQIDGR